MGSTIVCNLILYNSTIALIKYFSTFDTIVHSEEKIPFRINDK